MLFSKFLYKSVPKLPLIFLFLIFALLINKDPFSERSLIPNLEPYPDTIYYLSSAWNFAKGNGLSVQRDGRPLQSAVPALYTFTVLPAILVSQDVRMFYFTNVFLALTSLLLFYKIAKLIFKSLSLVYLLIFLYITNYFIYWYPTIAMAENLILPLYLFSVLLLLTKTTRTKVFLIGVCSILIYATKYASAPLSFALILLSLIKILFERSDNKEKIALFLCLVLSSAFSFLVFGVYEYITKGWILFAPLLGLLPSFSSYISKEGVVSSGTWTSGSYIPDNLKTYWWALNGYSMRFLWDQTPIVPKYIGTLGLVGFLIGILTRGFRFASYSLALSIFIVILGMSTFYTNDGRYIYHAIPSLILGFGIFLNYFLGFLSRRNLSILFYISIFILFFYYSFSNYGRLRYQIVLNLKYAETPWYYVSVKKLNSYFGSNPVSLSKKPIVISSMPAYYIDFYSSGNYDLLPLHNQQEFRGRFGQVYGYDNDYSDLIKLYESKLRDGYPVYLAKYGLGNEEYLKMMFEKIRGHFGAEEVMKECYDTCNLYRLEIKDNKTSN